MNVKDLAQQMIDSVRDFVERRAAPIEARISALEARPAPERGEKGDPGANGRDGVDGKDGAPGRDGIDGQDGAPGKDGADGRDGIDGKSVTLDEVRAYVDNEFATWALGFERRAHDLLQRAIDRIEKPKDGKDGRDGRDGRDGLGVEDFGVALDGRDLTLEISRGDFHKAHTIRVPFPIDVGVYREDATYEKGDGVTFGGSWWLAQKDAPQGKPGTSADWRLAVKKGRDGRDPR